ncbi:MAG: hypothetical protein MRY32_01510 [Rickettsiales bacterium]|nr:hypothetical protein [Rickettsiales bacterium]
MVNYTYLDILNQTVTFIPGADFLQFGNSSASSYDLTEINTLLQISRSGFSNVFLDSTSSTILSTTPGIFSLTNHDFDDNSKIVAGDLTTGLDDDSLASSLDFTTNAALIPIINNNNLVFGLEGADTIDISGGLGDNKIFGGQGGDTIIAGSGNNTIYGGDGLADTEDGGDAITVGSGSNTVIANAGDDSLVFSSLPGLGDTVSFYGGEGNDTITAGPSQARFDVFVGPGNDVINLAGLSNFNTYYGGEGDDTIDMSGGTGNVTIYGGDGIADSNDGSDAVTLGSGSVVAFLNSGSDSLQINSAVNQTATVYLGSGGDSVTSGIAGGDYVIFGNTDGDNIDLTNHAGNATIYGGNGVADSTDSGDTILGSSEGSEIIYGNSGADSITVQTSDNETSIVYAGSENDTITAAPTSGAAEVILYGNTGDDLFAMNFSNGIPIIRIKDYVFTEEDDADSIAVTLSADTGTTIAGSAADLDIVRVNGDTHLIRGANEHMVFEGFLGNFTDASAVFSDGSILETNFSNEGDSLDGGTGDDQLIAGDQSDTLTAGAGNDKLLGGLGVEQFVFTSDDIGIGDTVDGGASNDVVVLSSAGTAITDDAFTNMSSVEVLSLGGGDFSTNSITMGTQANEAGFFAVDATSATAATVNMAGLSRSVLFLGSGGDDSVLGGVGDDVLDGKDGDDVITGRRGEDIMKGGEGNDTFAYEQGVVDGNDTILDFDFGTSTESVDILQFNAGVANLNLGNNDAVVDGAIIDEIDSAGALGTEIIVLQSIGIATADITASLNIINADVDPTDQSISLFYDTTRGHVVMYVDSNGSTAGGHSLMASFTNLTSLSDMNNVDFGDFELVI